MYLTEAENIKKYTVTTSTIQQNLTAIISRTASEILPFFPFKNFMSDFPGDAVDKNPPANSGDMGSIPGQGRFDMLQGN